MPVRHTALASNWRLTQRLLVSLAIWLCLGLLAPAAAWAGQPVIDLQQGWRPAEVDLYHHTSEGTNLAPLELALALPDPNRPGHRFLDNLDQRYGFIASPVSAGNPHGLPVGLAVDPRPQRFGDRAYLGLTCAVCHTRELQARPLSWRQGLRPVRMPVHGGPALVNLPAFDSDFYGAFEALPFCAELRRERAASLLGQAGGHLDAVPGLSRAVPVALVQEMFGYDQSDPAEIRAWSFWNQFDAFHNQPFHASSQVDPSPERITAERQAANIRLGAYLSGLLQRRTAQLAAGGPSEGRGDPASRLLRLSQSGAVDFDIQRVARNLGGLLIGTIETTSQAVIHALSFLLADRERRKAAVAAAHQPEGQAIDGHVLEALRFHPPFPYFFRVCEQSTQLGLGMPWEQTIEPGTTVLTLNHAAMFDPMGFVDPDRFDPQRNQSLNFLFGHGHHQCLGRHIGAEIIPEIVRQVLRLPGLEAAGPVDRGGGPFPEHFPLRWTV